MQHERASRWWPSGVGGGLTLGQYARLLTGLMWFAWADWMTYSADIAFVPSLAVLLVAVSLMVMALAVVVRDERAQQRFDLLLLFGSVAIVTILGAVLASTRALGTDEIALNQGSAIQLLHGVNPYTADLSFALHQFGVGVGTLTLDGGVVSSASYPSLSFLLYVPAVAVLGLSSYAGVLVNLACWALAAVVLWRLTAPRMRAWLPLFFALPVFFGPVTGGNLDTLYLPFLLIALFAWDRFGDPEEKSVARWIGPVALGIACAIKQNPWLLAPFLVVGVSIEAHARGQDWRRVAARYIGLTAVPFLVCNLPFIIWGPASWLTRVLAPVGGNLIPAGVGPVDLIRAYGLGGGNLVLFSATALSALLAGVALFVWRYATLKRLLPLLPLAALFMASRSLTTYFAFSLPAIAVSAASVRSSARVQRGAWGLGVARAVSLAGAGASLLFFVGALATPAPLRLSVIHTEVTSANLVTQVRVENISTQAISPHFVLAEGRDFRVPLDVVSGPPDLPASGSATYALATAQMLPSFATTGSYQIQAVSASPASMSVTSRQALPQASALR